VVDRFPSAMFPLAVSFFRSLWQIGSDHRVVLFFATFSTIITKESPALPSVLFNPVKIVHLGTTGDGHVVCGLSILFNSLGIIAVWGFQEAHDSMVPIHAKQWCPCLYLFSQTI
jgi:hypothetical protein